jgi:hypothetical protein
MKKVRDGKAIRIGVKKVMMKIGISKVFSALTIIPLLSVVLLTSCRFTDWGDGDFIPPTDHAFVYQGTAPANLFTWNVALYDRYAFTSDGNGFICIYDAINVYMPHQVSSIDIGTGGQTIRNIEVDWRYNLYVAAGQAGLYIVNASSVFFPVVLAHVPHIHALDISLDDDYLAVIDRNGWKLYYISGHATLTEIGSFDYFLPKQPQKIMLRGNFVYVFSSDSLDIFDVTNPMFITLERTIPWFDFIDYTMVGSTLAVICRDYLYFIDTFRPTSASVVKEYGVRRIARSIGFNAGVLYMGWTDNSLSAFQLRDIFNLTDSDERARIVFEQNVFDIKFRNDVIFISNGAQGLKLYRLVL